MTLDSQVLSENLLQILIFFATICYLLQVAKTCNIGINIEGNTEDT